MQVDKTVPIIFLQSDHGVNRSMVDEPLESLIRIKNFIAIYLPNRCKKYLPKDLSLVNNFRIVKACLEDSAPALVKNKFYAIDLNSKKYLHDLTDSKVIFEP